MNITPISSYSAISDSAEAAKAAPAQQSTQTTPLPNDSVTLSQAAKNLSAGDVDHDGDSH